MTMRTDHTKFAAAPSDDKLVLDRSHVLKAVRKPGYLEGVAADVIAGYKAGLAGELRGFVSESFDLGWVDGHAERIRRAPVAAAPIAQEPPEPGVCAMCGHAFSIPDGLEPTEVCNTCAQEFYATHAAPQVAQEPVAPEHVAWCRYVRSPSDRPTRIALCDSDAEGAFKVYRAAPIAAPAGWKIERIYGPPELEGYLVSAPDGTSVSCWATDRNPKNLIFKFAKQFASPQRPT